MTALLLAAVLAGEVDAAELKRAIGSRSGRPVVVSLWATWCEPCVKEFPGLVALARDRPDIAVLSVSIDETESRAAVEALVEREKPPFPVYLRKPGPDQAFIDGVDRDWSGVVPATLVFDAKGRRTGLLQGEHSRKDIEKALEAPQP